MPYESLLADAWPKDRAVAEQDTYFLGELIHGHLIYHFSDRRTFSSWPKNAGLRIHNTLRYTAEHKRKVPPSCAVRALLVVLSMADDPKLKDEISSSYSAEVLWVAAFKVLAADCGQKFSMGEYTLAVRPRDGVNRDWFDTIFHHTPNCIRPYLKQALTRRGRRSGDRKAMEICGYWLAPWALGARPAGGVHVESPAMGAHTPYHPRALVEPVALTVQLPVSVAATKGNGDLGTTWDTDDVRLEVNSAVDSCSFETNSYLDSLFDEYSFATTATSLTSIEGAADPDTSISIPSIPNPDPGITQKRRAVWDPNYVPPHKGGRIRFWTEEGYWVEGVNFKYAAFVGYDCESPCARLRSEDEVDHHGLFPVPDGPPILGVTPRGPCYWEKPVPFQPSPEHAAWLAKRAKRRRFLFCLVRPWTWIRDRRNVPLEGSETC